MIDTDALTPLDLDAITGWDAIAYRAHFGSEIEVFLAHLTSLAPRSAADRAVMAWLWARQNGEPNISLQAIASQVPVLPPDVPSGADVDAPEPDAG